MSADELVKEGALGLREAQQFSGLGRSFLYEAMTNGELPYVKCGARRLIPKQALVQYLADRLKDRNRR
jgi:excisionase family DNA binding protein